MRVHTPRLTALFRDSLNEVRSAGVQPSDDDVAWLFDLSRRVVEAGESSRHAVMAPVVELNGLCLYQPTIAARIWMDSAAEWFADNALIDLLATTYAMAHGREPGAFDGMWNATDADKRLRAWGVKNVTVTYSALRRALEVFLGGHTVSVESATIRQGEDTETEWGTIIARMCYWYKMSPESVMRIEEPLFWTMAQTALNDGGEIKKRDPEAIPLEELRLARKEIIRRAKAA